MSFRRTPESRKYNALDPGFRRGDEYFSASKKETVWGDVGGDSWLNNGGANYSANFNVQAVPEPATMSLLGLGALAMVLRRKIRK